MHPTRPRLETFGPACIPAHPAWTQLTKWWFKHEQGANTPNWDIALWWELEGCRGLILVEAKAHKTELKIGGKILESNASAQSQANHAQITAAIDEACRRKLMLEPKLALHGGSHYQLANRLAFTWKLATLGIPAVLIYLGFVGDAGIADLSPPFMTSADWHRSFEQHAKATACQSLFERRLDCGAASAWLLVRAREVLRVSPPGY